jgi:hypothetical protein
MDKSFKELKIDGPIREIPTKLTSKHPSRHLSIIPINVFTTSIPATSKPIIYKLSIDYPNITEALDSPSIDNLLISAIYIQIKGDKAVDNIPLITYYTRYNVLNEFF